MQKDQFLLCQGCLCYKQDRLLLLYMGNRLYPGSHQHKLHLCQKPIPDHSYLLKGLSSQRSLQHHRLRRCQAYYLTDSILSEYPGYRFRHPWIRFLLQFLFLSHTFQLISSAERQLRSYRLQDEYCHRLLPVRILLPEPLMRSQILLKVLQILFSSFSSPRHFFNCFFLPFAHKVF